MQLLVVSKEQPFAKGVESILGIHGHRVAHYADIDEALQAVSLDVVSAVLIHADRADGETLRTISRAKNAGAREIFVCARDVSDDASEAAFMHGVRFIFDAPLRPNILLAQIALLNPTSALPSLPSTHITETHAEPVSLPGKPLSLFDDRLTQKLLHNPRRLDIVANTALETVCLSASLSKAMLFAVDDKTPGSFGYLASFGVINRLLDPGLPIVSGIGAALRRYGHVVSRGTPTDALTVQQLAELGMEAAIPVSADGKLLAILLIGRCVNGTPPNKQTLETVFAQCRDLGRLIAHISSFVRTSTSDNMLASLLHGLQGIILLFDEHLNIVFANAVATRVFSPTSRLDATRLPNGLTSFLSTAIQASPAKDLPSFRLNYEGRQFSFIAHRISHENATFLTLVGTDETPSIEESRQKIAGAQRALLQSAGAQIAHIFNNSLTPLHTFTQIAPERQGDPSFLPEAIEGMLPSLRRMLRETQRISLLAESIKMAPTTVPVTAAITDAWNAVTGLFAASTPPTLSIKIEPESFVPLVRAPSDLLRSLLVEILHNALVFSSKSNVEISVANIDQRDVEICVHDFGPGFPADLLNCFPQPFVTFGSATGIGIGLTIAHRHAERLNGRLTIGHSDVTTGGVVCLHLPLIQ